MQTRDLPHRQACAAWSNRALIVSLLGIAYLTLFPFRLRRIPWERFDRSPFLLGPSIKHAGSFDFFLNVLLFIPFGFAIAAQARKRGLGRAASLVVAIVCGALVSYSVEFVQLFIPQRDSGWDDVVSNTLGSGVGFFVFELCGGLALGTLSRWEAYFRAWLTPVRAAALLSLYFALWFGISFRLQRETRLANWDPRCTLLVGNDATGGAPWKGTVSRLQIWNRALPESAIEQIAANAAVDSPPGSLQASYDFTGAAPFADQSNRLPALDWAPAAPKEAGTADVELPGSAWLTSRVPAEELVSEIKKTNQFTIHIVCVPAVNVNASGRIVSLSESRENVNFHLRQQDANLYFFFRNPLSETRSNLVWFVGGILAPGQVRDIVAEYDGADAFLYIDGKPQPRKYRLGPGASLIHKFLFIQTGDLEGYTDIYETLVFMPAGFLIGMAIWGEAGGTRIFGSLLIGGSIAWVALLEFLLAFESGRRIWPENIEMSLILGLAGVLIANADRRYETEDATLENST